MLIDYLKVIPQFFLPTHLISKLFFIATRSRRPGWKNWLINWFIKTYRVDMSVAVEQNVANFPDFNSFFTRALLPGARPLAREHGAVVSPVDGAVSQCGSIEGGSIFQAKGHRFTLEQLLADTGADSKQFHNGSFCTIYLSPRDYHRIHMPVPGRVLAMTHIPGRLFSVNAATTRRIRALFARNERVAVWFDTPVGKMAMVLVGALNVSQIDTVWAQGVRGPDPYSIHRWSYLDADRIISLEKGDEMGRFNMGSTVILLFEAEKIRWAQDLAAGSPVRMGQSIGRAIPPPAPAKKAEQ